MPVFSPIFPIFHCCLRNWNFSCSTNRNQLVFQIVTAQSSYSFRGDVIFVVPVRHTFQSYSHGFDSINNKNILSFVSQYCDNFSRNNLLALKHCCWHQNFQLSTSVFSWCVQILLHLVQRRRYNAILWHYRASVYQKPIFALFLEVEFSLPRFCGFCTFVASGDATSQMGSSTRISPKCCGDSCCEDHAHRQSSGLILDATRQPSTIRFPQRRRAKARGLVQPKVWAKVPTSRCHVTMQRDSQLQFRNNAFQCLQIKLSRQPDPESPNSSNCSPRWAKRTTCTCRPGSTLEGRVPSTRTTCVRAHPVDQKFCRQETKASRTGQGSNRESARGSELGHGLSEGGGKVARRGRTEACSSPVSIPSQSSLQRQRGGGSFEGRDLQIATAAGWDPSCCCQCGSQSHPRGTKNWNLG